jgi:hypothetical protein
MGPFRAPATLPLAPVRGVRWVADLPEREPAERQSPQRALAELDAKRANGKISDEDAEALDAQMIEQMLSSHGLSGEA